MDDATRKRLMDKSGAGEQLTFPKYETPVISMDGNRGEFQKKLVDGTVVPLTAPFNVYVLKKRNTLQTKLGTSPEYFSSEYSSPLDPAALYEKIGGKVTFVGAGNAQSLRMKFPMVKTAQILYVLHEGEVCRMILRSTSAAEFYNFQTRMTEEGKHSIDYALTVSKKEGETMVGSMKKKYFSMTFTDGEFDADVATYEEKLDEVNAAIEKMDAYQKAKNAQSVQAAPQSAADIEFDNAGKQDTPNPDDIPF
jgi:hypothetical protein